MAITFDSAHDEKTVTVQGAVSYIDSAQVILERLLQTQSGAHVHRALEALATAKTDLEGTQQPGTPQQNVPVYEEPLTVKDIDQTLRALWPQNATLRTSLLELSVTHPDVVMECFSADEESTKLSLTLLPVLMKIQQKEPSATAPDHTCTDPTPTLNAAAATTTNPLHSEADNEAAAEADAMERGESSGATPGMTTIPEDRPATEPLKRRAPEPQRVTAADEMQQGLLASTGLENGGSGVRGQAAAAPKSGWCPTAWACSCPPWCPDWCVTGKGCCEKAEEWFFKVLVFVTFPVFLCCKYKMFGLAYGLYCAQNLLRVYLIKAEGHKVAYRFYAAVTVLLVLAMVYKQYENFKAKPGRRGTR